jgi:transcriptional regulator with XRE-family HTH domain
VSEPDEPGERVWGSVGEFIKSQRELANLSLRQLAEIAKISNPYLSQVERGLHKPSADVLKNLASALKISAQTMYTQAGLLDATAAQAAAGGTGPAAAAQPGIEVETAIRTDARLSEDQKETLVRIYRGFVERA